MHQKTFHMIKMPNFMENRLWEALQIFSNSQMNWKMMPISLGYKSWTKLQAEFQKIFSNSQTNLKMTPISLGYKSWTKLQVEFQKIFLNSQMNWKMTPISLGYKFWTKLQVEFQKDQTIFMVKKVKYKSSDCDSSFNMNLILFIFCFLWKIIDNRCSKDRFLGIKSSVGQKQ